MTMYLYYRNVYFVFIKRVNFAFVVLQELMYKVKRVSAFFEKVSQSHLPRY